MKLKALKFELTSSSWPRNSQRRRYWPNSAAISFLFSNCRACKSTEKFKAGCKRVSKQHQKRGSFCLVVREFLFHCEIWTGPLNTSRNRLPAELEKKKEERRKKHNEIQSKLQNVLLDRGEPNLFLFCFFFNPLLRIFS